MKNGLVNFNMKIYDFNLVSSNLLQTTGELLQEINIFEYVKHTVEKYLSWRNNLHDYQRKTKWTKIYTPYKIKFHINNNLRVANVNKFV